MWFLNKTTGLKWEVSDKELIKRLSKDSNYEEIKETVEKKEVKVEKKETKKTTTTTKKKQVINLIEVLKDLLGVDEFDDSKNSVLTH